MAFFEQIGKSISAAGYTVSKSTKNVADLAAYNSAVSERNRQIEKLYLEIGEAYYSNHRDDSRAEEIDKIAEINTLKAEIADYEKKILKTKNATVCPGCGKEISSNALFCNNCGMKIEREAREPLPGSRTCPKCGAVIAEGSRFCTSCGAKIDSSSRAAE